MRTREEILMSYDGKKPCVIILEKVIKYSDEVIKQVIRNVDNVVLTRALSGASGEVCQKFLLNISDKLLPYIHEDIKNCVTGVGEITEAQKKIMELLGCNEDNN